MRVNVGFLMLSLGGCSGGESDQPARAPQEHSAEAPAAAAEATPVQASLMAIPADPRAVKRLEAMGYTVHREEGHLHAPGVKGCPAMADGPIM